MRAEVAEKQVRLSAPGVGPSGESGKASGSGGVNGKPPAAAEGRGLLGRDGVWERKEFSAEMLEVAGKESNVGGVLGHEDDLDAGSGSEFGEPVGGVLSATER